MFALWGQRMCLETVNRIFHADIALIKLFQGLAVIFLDTALLADGWLVRERRLAQASTPTNDC